MLLKSKARDPKGGAQIAHLESLLTAEQKIKEQKNQKPPVFFYTLCFLPEESYTG